MRDAAPDRRPWQRQVGFSYIEMLVTALILTVSLVPMLSSLQTAISAADAHASESALQYRLFGRMEEIMAESFTALAAEALAVGSPKIPTAYSDIPGTLDRRLVFLSDYDGDNADGDDDPFTGSDPGLVWVRVEIEATVLAIESLKAQ